MDLADSDIDCSDRVIVVYLDQIGRACEGQEVAQLAELQSNLDRLDFVGLEAGV